MKRIKYLITLTNVLIIMMSFTSLRAQEDIEAHVNLEVISDKDCYSAGERVRILLVSRLYSSSSMSCTSAGPSIQARDLLYSMSVTFSDGREWSLEDVPATTKASTDHLTFQFVDNDVKNSKAGAVNPALDVCDDVDYNCTMTSACGDFDPSSPFSSQADWVHELCFNLPDDLKTGTFDINASERFSIWINSGGEWRRDSDGLELDELETTIDQNCNSLILPLTLARFSLEEQDGSTLIKWDTEAELNVRYFDVQRSINSSRFESVGRVDAIGIFEGSSYQFVDTDISNGTYLYRLRMTADDGETFLGPVESIDVFLGDAKPSLFPNPFDREIALTGFQESALIHVFDLSGQEVFQGHVAPRTSIDLSHLSSGIYVVSYLDKGELIKHRLIKH